MRHGKIDIIGGQIAFPADAVPSGDPNTIDDYEEGTWTPVVADASTGGNTASLDTSVGNYTLIGRAVIFEINLTDINTSGMTGGNLLFIRNFPFSITSTGGYVTKVDKINFTGYVTATQSAGNTYMLLTDNIDSLADVLLTVAAIVDATTDITISGVGRVS